MKVNMIEYGCDTVFAFQKPNLVTLQFKDALPLSNDVPIPFDDTTQFAKHKLLFFEIPNKSLATLFLESLIRHLPMMPFASQRREKRRDDLVDDGWRHFRVF